MAKRKKFKITKKEKNSILFGIAFGVGATLLTPLVEAYSIGINHWIKAVIGVSIILITAYLFKIN